MACGWRVHEGQRHLVDLYAYLVCMGFEPTGAITIAKKGVLPAWVKKAMKKRAK
jgi:hypothetical protein